MLCAFVIATASGATLSVGPGQPYATISDAVAAAAAGDRIEIDAGTYAEAGTVLVDRDLAFVGLGGSSGTTWSAPADSDVIEIVGAVTATFEGLTVNAGLRARSFDIAGADVTLTDVVVDGNTGPAAGDPHGVALRAADATVTIDLSTFRNNSAVNQGGGLYVERTALTVTSSLFQNNALLGLSEGRGAALWVADASSLSSAGNTYRGNSGRLGTIYTDESTVTIDGDVVELNDGGVLVNDTPSSTIVDTLFRQNLGDSAVYLYQVDVAQVVDSSFEDNVTDTTLYLLSGADLVVSGTRFIANDGAALYYAGAGTVEILDNEIEEHHYVGNGGGVSIGLWTSPVQSTVRIAGNLFVSNESDSAGGAVEVDGHAVDAALDLEDNVFLGNTANRGGAIYLRLREVRASGNTFCGNQAMEWGGAVVTWEASPTLVQDWHNNLFLDNDATVDGGALYLRELRAGVVNNTFLGNSAQHGGAAFAYDSTLDFVNNVVAFHSGHGLDEDMSTVRVSYSDFHDNLPQHLALSIVPGSGMVYADPMFVAYTDDGICDNDILAPDVGSPLIDAGDPTIVDADGSISDMGATGGPEGLVLLEDEDGDGASSLVDCDDTDPSVYPGAAETCNDVDDDCDGATDNTGAQVVWRQDLDTDGFGDDATAVTADCPPDPAWIDVGGDCDDGDPDIHPDAVETCNAVDDDCDGTIDNTGVPAVWWQDQDGDGFGDDTTAIAADCAPDATWMEEGGDCDDTDATVHPGATEVPGDGIDQDCDTLDPPAEPTATGTTGTGSTTSTDDLGAAQEEPGCGCASGQPAPSGGAALALLLGAWLLPRRRPVGP